MLGSVFVHTHNYPGRMTIHLMPFAVAMAVTRRGRCWRNGSESGSRRSTGRAERHGCLRRNDPEAVRLGRRKRRVFAALAVAFALATFSAAGVDIYLHGKYQRSAGFNMWGYRGPAAGRKQPGEYRIAILAAARPTATVSSGRNRSRRCSSAAGAATAGGPTRVVNLGYNNEGAYSFTFTMKDYAVASTTTWPCSTRATTI